MLQSAQLVKRFYRFVLKKAVGRFLKNDLDLDHLDVQLREGVVVLSALHLDPDILNALLGLAGEEAGSLVLVSGFIKSVRLVIPWTSLLQDASHIEVQGLDLCFGTRDQLHQSNVHHNSVRMGSSVADMRGSKWGQGNAGGGVNPHASPPNAAFDMGQQRRELEGLEELSDLIEGVLARVQLSVVQTRVRLLHPSHNPWSPTPPTFPWMALCVPFVGLDDASARPEGAPSDPDDPVLRKVVTVTGVSVVVEEGSSLASLGLDFDPHPDIDDLSDVHDGSASGAESLPSSSPPSSPPLSSPSAPASPSALRLPSTVVLSACPPSSSLVVRLTIRPSQPDAPLAPSSPSPGAPAPRPCPDEPWLEGVCVVPPCVVCVAPKHLAALSCLAAAYSQQWVASSSFGDIGASIAHLAHSSEKTIIRSLLLEEFPELNDQDSDDDNGGMQFFDPKHSRFGGSCRSAANANAVQVRMAVDWSRLDLFVSPRVSPQWFPNVAPKDSLVCRIGKIGGSIEISDARLRASLNARSFQAVHCTPRSATNGPAASLQELSPAAPSHSFARVVHVNPRRADRQEHGECVSVVLESHLPQPPQDTPEGGAAPSNASPALPPPSLVVEGGEVEVVVTEALLESLSPLLHALDAGGGAVQADRARAGESGRVDGQWEARGESPQGQEGGFNAEKIEEVLEHLGRVLSPSPQGPGLATPPPSLLQTTRLRVSVPSCVVCAHAQLHAAPPCNKADEGRGGGEKVLRLVCDAPVLRSLLPPSQLRGAREGGHNADQPSEPEGEEGCITLAWECKEVRLEIAQPSALRSSPPALVLCAQAHPCMPSVGVSGELVVVSGDHVTLPPSPSGLPSHPAGRVPRPSSSPPWQRNGRDGNGEGLDSMRRPSSGEGDGDGDGEGEGEGDESVLDFRSRVLASSRVRVSVAVPVLRSDLTKAVFDSACDVVGGVGASFAAALASAAPPPPRDDGQVLQGGQPFGQLAAKLVESVGAVGSEEGPREEGEGEGEGEEEVLAGQKRSVHNGTGRSMASTMRSGNTLYYSVCGWDSEEEERQELHQYPPPPPSQGGGLRYASTSSPLSVLISVSHLEMTTRHTPHEPLRSNASSVVHSLVADDAVLFAVPSFRGSAHSLTSLSLFDFTLSRSEGREAEATRVLMCATPLRDRDKGSMFLLVARSDGSQAPSAAGEEARGDKGEGQEEQGNGTFVALRSVHVHAKPNDAWLGDLSVFFTPPARPSEQPPADAHLAGGAKEDEGADGEGPEDEGAASSSLVVSLTNFVLEVGVEEAAGAGIGFAAGRLVLLVHFAPLLTEYHVDLRDSQAMVAVARKRCDEPDGMVDLAAVLESAGYVRVALLDYLRVRVKHRVACEEVPSGSVEVDVTNHNLLLLTCSDSFNALVDTTMAFASSAPSNPAPPESLPPPSLPPPSLPPPSLVPQLFVGQRGVRAVGGQVDALAGIAPHMFGSDRAVQQDERQAGEGGEGGEAGRFVGVRLQEDYASARVGAVPRADDQHSHPPQHSEFSARWLHNPCSSPAHASPSHASPSPAPPVIADYVGVPDASPPSSASPFAPPPPHSRPPSLVFSLRDVSLQWRMFGGADFAAPGPPSPSPSSSAHHDDDDVASHANHYLAPLHRSRVAGVVGGSGGGGKASRRRDNQMMELRVGRVNTVVRAFGGEDADNDDRSSAWVLVWDAHFSVETLELIDALPSSSWNKFLCALQPSEQHRKLRGAVVRGSVVAVLPSAFVAECEYRVELDVRPLRLHIDQDAVEFLAAFFAPPPAKPQRTSSARSASSEAHPSRQPQPQQPRREGEGNGESEGDGEGEGAGAHQPQSPPAAYLQRVRVSDLVFVVDYKPKHVDVDRLVGGGLEEAVNFVAVEGVEVRLPGTVLRGVSGPHALGEKLVALWTPVVVNTQLVKYVAGVTPIKSLVRLGDHAWRLASLPFSKRRADELSSGVKRSGSGLLWTLAVELIDLTARASGRTQSLLERADGVFTRKSQREPSAATARAQRSRLASQPSNARDGMHQAYESLSRGLRGAAHSLVHVPADEYSRHGTHAYVQSVVQGVPSAVLQPAIGATQAVSKALQGVRHEVDPQRRRQLQDKYR